MLHAYTHTKHFNRRHHVDQAKWLASPLTAQSKLQIFQNIMLIIVSNIFKSVSI